MAFHHVALAARDMRAIDAFYTEATGFDLVKVEPARTPAGGWAKHFFYDTGDGELMAFWELHDDTLPQDFPTSLARATGLPEWVNHLAFAASSQEDLDARRQRWLEHGYDVLEIDHHWCISIYTLDPNGVMVEFCLTTAEFSAEDRAAARAALESDELEFGPEAIQTVHKAECKPLHRRLSAA